MTKKANCPETSNGSRYTQADRIRALKTAESAPIIPINNNLVPRPWAGHRLCAYKQVQASREGAWGEAFEICAHDEDKEAAQHPSNVCLADGSTITLPELLTASGESILGEEFVRTNGSNIPLLPKTLDVGELLSIQAHPEGFTEAYFIVEADEGATIRLGFKHDVDPSELGKSLKRGIRLQHELLDVLGDDIDQHQLQAVLKGYFSARDAPLEATLP